MKKITKIVGEVGTTLRDRSRSVKRRVFDIARAARSKTKQRSEKLTRAYDQLLNSTSRVVGQAKRFSAEIAASVKRSTNPLAQLKLEADARRDGAACEAGTEANQGAHPSRRYALRRPAAERVRTLDGDYPQRQIGKTQRIWQDGEAAGSRKPDRDRF
jgi:hypothetical protein